MHAAARSCIWRPDSAHQLLQSRTAMAGIRVLVVVGLIATALGAGPVPLPFPGRCEPPCVCVQATCPCSQEPSCPLGYNCVNGFCAKSVPTCASVLCQVGYICRNGQCIKNTYSCSGIRCRTGYMCRYGRCFPLELRASSSSCPRPCAANFRCLRGTCRRMRCRQRCVVGYVCRMGRCVPRR